MKYIGVDIGGTNIVAGLVEEMNNNYHVLSTMWCKTKVAKGTEYVVSAVKELYEKLLIRNNVSEKEIKWVGVGVPGSVNRKTGIIGFSSNFNATDWNIREDLKNALKKNVIVINDADAYAYGEYVEGAIRNEKNAIVLTIGTGIGCGIIIDGKPYSSTNFAAGEVGHMVIDCSGRECSCGRRGCFETYASATGLINTTKREVLRCRYPERTYIYKISNGLQRVSAKTPFVAKKIGDYLGTKIVDKYIYYLGCGITNLVNIFQPDVVCLGGGVSQQGEFLFEPLAEHVNKYKYKVLPFEGVKIVGAENKNNAAIIGAVAVGKIL